MELRKINCREHGGTFRVPVKRGRPPVRCTKDNPCTTLSQRKVNPQAARRAAQTNKGPVISKVVAPEFSNQPEVVAVVQESARRMRKKPRRAAAEVTTVVNPSIPLAHKVKTLLEPLGWVLKGRAWTDEDKVGHAEVTATRGEELITISWADGELVNQNYSLWSTEKPSTNDKPRSRLPFDPDEMPDQELIRKISGQKVTWWNRLGTNQESAVVSKDRIQIDHTFNGSGDETPGERIVKFVDHGGGGFRAFRVAAMIKIG